MVWAGKEIACYWTDEHVPQGNIAKQTTEHRRGAIANAGNPGSILAFLVGVRLILSIHARRHGRLDCLFVVEAMLYMYIRSFVCRARFSLVCLF